MDFDCSGPCIALVLQKENAVVVAVSAALTYLNWRGLQLVGGMSKAYMLFILAPFVFTTVLSAPNMDFARCWETADAASLQWEKLVNVLFWKRFLQEGRTVGLLGHDELERVVVGLQRQVEALRTDYADVQRPPKQI